MSRPHSASATASSGSADNTPCVHVEIIKRDSGRFLAVSAEVRVLGTGESPEEATDEFVSNASFFVQYERDNGREGLFKDDRERRLKDRLSELNLQNEKLHSSREVQLKLVPLDNVEWVPIEEALAWDELPL